MFACSRHRGTGLVEITSLLSVLALGAALLVPTVSNVTMESRRIRSVENLRQIGGNAGRWSGGREDGIIHPQSTGGETAWFGLGAWDWGGTNGTRFDYSSIGDFAADTRPLNKVGPPGRSLHTSANPSVFHAPADSGLIAGLHDPSDGDVSMALWTGTSYKGDFVWYPNVGGDGALRFGTFMRPLNLMPLPAETTLFYEARFGDAFLFSEEYAEYNQGWVGGPATTVPGCYGDKNKFCVLFADGHVRTLRLRQSGDMYPLESFDQIKYPYWVIMARGPGWRTDCFPAPFIEEHSVGNP